VEKAQRTNPIAVALGTDPGLPYIGGMPIPEGMDKAAFLGAYFGEPLELVPAETVPVNVPASAESVIEGHVSHTETAMEGPMDEYPGYVGHDGSPKPVLHVSAVTFRNNPILPFFVAGAPVTRITQVGTFHTRPRSSTFFGRPGCNSDRACPMDRCPQMSSDVRFPLHSQLLGGSGEEAPNAVGNAGRLVCTKCHEMSCLENYGYALLWIEVHHKTGAEGWQGSLHVG
jgi:hypothetical protein